MPAGHDFRRDSIGVVGIGLRVHPRLHHLLARGGRGRHLMLAEQRDEAFGGGLEPRGRTQHQPALEARGRHRDVPPFAFARDAVLDRHAHFVEEQLGKARIAVELADRAARDPRGVEVEQDETQPLVPLRLGVGAEQAEPPVGEARAARPGLLAGDDIMVAVADRLRRDRRHVRPGIGLGPCLRPDHLALRHRGQEARLLLVGAELHDGRAEQEDAVLINAQRRPRAIIFLFEDQPLDEVEPAPAVSLGPGDHAPVAACEPPLPLDMLVIAVLALERDERFLRDVRFHPRAHFCAEILLFGCVGEVHQNSAALPVSTKASRDFWLSSCIYISSVKPCSQR